MSRPKKVQHKHHSKLSAIQVACIVLASLILIACASFGGYLLYEKAAYERALKNYPVAYVDEIRTQAEAFNLDPYLVISIMRCESSFDPSAVSSRGAIGLMQVMPDTGEWIAHKLDMDDVYQEAMLYDPQTNIQFGCWYLNFVSGRFDSYTTAMIAAYNAGHGAVRDWLADDRYTKGGELILIPYPETERYVARVTKAYENYTALYPNLFDEQANDVADYDLS